MLGIGARRTRRTLFFNKKRGSTIGVHYYAGTRCSNQDQIWCVNMGEYTFFGFIVGPDYYGMASLNTAITG